MNEPRLIGHSQEWWFPRNNPSQDIKEAVACINDYNQVALDAIRATGGNNATRCVMIPGYDASIEGCMTDTFAMPKDSASDRLILSVHAYIPYRFALASDNFTTKFDDSNKGDIDSFFNDLNSKFLSKNVPVVVGETSATNRNNRADRVKWADYYWEKAAKYSNVAIVLWDNSIYDNNSAGSNGECHRYIDRSTLQWTVPEIISAIMKHVDGITTPTPQPTPAPAPVLTQKPAADGLKAEYTINNWGSGYQVLIKVKNNSSSKVNNWTVKVNKKDVKIDSSWSVNIAEEAKYYVITPMSWNSSIEPGASVDFGIQGNGSIGSTVDITVQ